MHVYTISSSGPFLVVHISAVTVLIQLVQPFEKYSVYNIIFFFAVLLHVVNTSVTCDAPAVCPGERVLCSCTTAYSDFLAWSIINDGGELMYHSGYLPQFKQRWIMPNSNISAEISNISVLNEVVVLKSELSLSFVFESRYIILRCENFEDHDSYSIILPMSSKCSVSLIVKKENTYSLQSNIFNIALGGGVAAYSY